MFILNTQLFCHHCLGNTVYQPSQSSGTARGITRNLEIRKYTGGCISPTYKQYAILSISIFWHGRSLGTSPKDMQGKKIHISKSIRILYLVQYPEAIF